jgi:thiosulfate/3-mercaptopyruvate sulfurtransferase
MRGMPTTLIEPLALRERLDDPHWATIDCRFDLTQPGWGARAFAAGHIPGALYADLDRDLSGPRTALSGRHPLPEPAVLAATLSRFGIDATVQVVAYDQGAGSFAARLWWLLRWLGHREVAVLDGGFAAWERAGLPVSSAIEARAPRQFSARPDASLVAGTAEVAAAVDSGALTRREAILVDARSADRFAGENESIDPVAGHIPGARNHPFSGNHDAQGRFLAPAELERAWQDTLRGGAARQLIAMCGSGVTACHNLLALEIAGLSGARLYAGSWSEWIRDPAHAVARGKESAG